MKRDDGKFHHRPLCNVVSGTTPCQELVQHRDLLRFAHTTKRCESSQYRYLRAPCLAGDRNWHREQFRNRDVRVGSGSGSVRAPAAAVPSRPGRPAEHEVRVHGKRAPRKRRRHFRGIGDRVSAPITSNAVTLLSERRAHQDGWPSRRRRPRHRGGDTGASRKRLAFAIRTTVLNLARFWISFTHRENDWLFARYFSGCERHRSLEHFYITFLVKAWN